MAEIGRGSFGRAFLATEPALGGRQVVVKIAPHGGEEADVLGRLRHPNIVPIYSLQEDAAGLTAFCMPYLGRATLESALDHAFAGHPPTRASVILDAIAAANDGLELDPSAPDPFLHKASYVDGVVHLAAQLAEALAHAHGRGICHRDLKPSNVLMTPDGRPLLLDFNLSADYHLQAAKIGGTLPYMAPEELAAIFQNPSAAAPRHYDPRSDLFSLGVMIYELLTGELPFGDIPWKLSLDGLAFQLHQQQQQGPRPIRQYNRQVDPRLARLVESCLAFEPDARPETAHALAAAFRKELTPVRRTRRWMGNHRRLVTATGAMFLAFVLGTSLFLALRPSYGARQLRDGLAHERQGQYALAVDCLTDSLRDDPNSSEALFARGRAEQRLGQYYQALLDYRASYQLNPAPIVKVWEGYCADLWHAYYDAIAAYEWALKGGCRSPAIYNNLGFSCYYVAQFGEAEKYLQRAIEMDGDLQPPRYGMVLVWLHRVLHEKRPIPEAALGSRPARD